MVLVRNRCISIIIDPFELRNAVSRNIILSKKLCEVMKNNPHTLSGPKYMEIVLKLNFFEISVQIDLLK
jgi:hypothetical protein